MQAWAPLARGLRFDNEKVVKFAKKYNKSPAQILLRWGLQKVRRSLLHLSLFRIDPNTEFCHYSQERFRQAYQG